MTQGRAATYSFEGSFWARVERRDASQCWPWTGSLSRNGGHGKFHGRPAHRIAWELIRGLVPEGLELDHLCRTPACVNPAHLEPVTHATNMARGSIARKTHCRAGHPFDEANTYRPSSGAYRQCRRCNAAAVARYKSRKTQP